MSEQSDKEISVTAQMILVITLVAFSTILVILNFLLSWEKWTVPLAIAAVPSVLVMYVTHRPNRELRTNIYAIILLVETFYYVANINTVYDGTGVILLAMIVLVTTRRRMLIWAGYLIGNLALIEHILLVNVAGEGSLSSKSSIVRTVWCFVILLLGAVVSDRLIMLDRRQKNHFFEKLKENEAANKSASDFLANVSHEIRTPINAVIGLSGVCIDREDDADIRSDLFSIRDAGKRVATQISDILDYSEIDRGDLAVNEEDYMISSVLNDIITELRPYMKEELEIVIDVDPELPSMMRTDVSKLKKIIWHLMMNGIKYTKRGGVYVRVSSKQQQYGINLVIEVVDTGVGMTEEELERVFERFYQADSGRSRAVSGLGLGMSIVSGFVYTLGGFLTIKSEPDAGTTVRVSLPQQVIDPVGCMSVMTPRDLHIAGFLHFEKFDHPQVRDFYNSVVANIVRGLKVEMHRVESGDDLRELSEKMKLTHLFVGEQEYLTNKKLVEDLAQNDVTVEVIAGPKLRVPRLSHVNIMRKPFYCFPVVSALNSNGDIDLSEIGKMYCPGIRALVVDDEPMNLMVALGVFRGYGMIVETAESGLESIRMCRENRYDIVFMDHMMPGMDGVEAMKKIRVEAGRQHSDFPIVALTANAVSSAREMFMREGFDGFVSKPIEAMELERVLRHVLPKSAVVFETDYNRTNRDSYSYLTEEDIVEFAPVSGDEPEEKTTSILQGLEDAGIDTSKGMHYCQGDEAFYKQLLMQFVKEASEKKTGMRESMKTEDMAGYAVFVHAIKSTAKMIGAVDLSEKARLLEEAAKKEDKVYVESNHDTMLAEYESITGIINRECGDGPEPEIPELILPHPDDEPPATPIVKPAPKETEEALTFDPEPKPKEKPEAITFEPQPTVSVVEEILSEPKAEPEAITFEPQPIQKKEEATSLTITSKNDESDSEVKIESKKPDEPVEWKFIPEGGDEG